MIICIKNIMRKSIIYLSRISIENYRTYPTYFVLIMVKVIEVLGDISAAPFPNILGNQIPNETKYVEIKKI